MFYLYLGIRLQILKIILMYKIIAPCASALGALLLAFTRAIRAKHFAAALHPPTALSRSTLAKWAPRAEPLLLPATPSSGHWDSRRLVRCGNGCDEEGEDVR